MAFDDDVGICHKLKSDGVIEDNKMKAFRKQWGHSSKAVCAKTKVSAATIV